MFDLENPVFRHFGLSALLVLSKMLAMSLITSSRRIKNGKFANREDAALISDKKTPVDIRVRTVNQLLFNFLQFLSSLR